MKKWNVTSNYDRMKGYESVGTFAHIQAEPGDGTNYDLLVTKDPYGGFLIVWPSMGEVWRGFTDGKVKVLSNDVNPFSTKAICEIWIRFIIEVELPYEDLVKCCLCGVLSDQTPVFVVPQDPDPSTWGVNPPTLCKACQLKTLEDFQ